jgi:ABC-type polysaccharide/polyol phosphate transport system ATPase subunit
MIKVHNIAVTYNKAILKGVSLKELFSGSAQKKAINGSFNALENVTFEIRSGERVGIIGRNGAGKSTLLKTLSGIIEPSSGNISLCGKVTALLEMGAGFNPELTGRENIFFNGAMHGFMKKTLIEEFDSIQDFSDASEFIDLPLKYYSSGMSMKLAFSLATAVRPEILILDEMFVGGDYKFVERGMDRMFKFIDDAKLMIFVSHDAKLLRRICNRFIWLENGSIKSDGGQEVLNDYLSQ